MIPCDMEQLLASRTEFGDDLVLQLIAAWLKEPAAVAQMLLGKGVDVLFTPSVPALILV